MKRLSPRRAVVQSRSINNAVTFKGLQKKGGISRITLSQLEWIWEISFIWQLYLTVTVRN